MMFDGCELPHCTSMSDALSDDCSPRSLSDGLLDDLTVRDLTIRLEHSSQRFVRSLHHPSFDTFNHYVYHNMQIVKHMILM